MSAAPVTTGRKHRFHRVAITGGGGYVGSVLVPELVRCGYEVTVLDWFLYGEDVLEGMDGQRLHRVKLDLRDEAAVAAAVQEMDAVIHLACISNDPSFELDPQLGRSVNYEAFQGLLSAVRAAPTIRRFIYASSSSVYGIKEESEVCEDMTCEPLTAYAQYKWRCEEVLRNEGLGDCEWVILRPATVCGYAPRLRLDLTVNTLTIHALVNKRITVFGGSQRRPNLNINDMVAVYRLLLEAPATAIDGQTFNVGYQNRTVADLAQLVRREVGDPDVTITMEPSNDLRSYHINSDWIRQRLGFSPRGTIEQAVQSLCQAYRAGRIHEPLTNPRYYNIKMMQSVGVGTMAGWSHA